MRIVIGEDQALLREGIARLLEEAGFDVVGQAGTADELIASVGAQTPDVAIVDLPTPRNAAGPRRVEARPRRKVCGSVGN